MARDFREKYDALPAKRRVKIERGVEKKLHDIQLSELRKIVDLTQQQLAERLEKSQAAISKMEKQKDLNISTLRKCIEAMGLELDVSVKAPDKKRYRLATFSSRKVHI